MYFEAVDPRLVRALASMTGLPPAEAWRRLAPVAGRLGVRRPSYPTVRRILAVYRELALIKQARRRQRDRLFADLLAGKVPWGWLNDRIAGGGLE